MEAKTLLNYMLGRSAKQDPYDFDDLYSLLMAKPEDNTTTGTGTITTTGSASGNNYGNAVNPYGPLPVQGPISQGYGAKVNYESGGIHHGVDIAIPKGTSIPSVQSGTVLEAGNNGAWGNTVVIQNSDGTKARYSHLSQINVKPGSQISAGNVLGLSGNTGLSFGKSGGYHLDYRIYK